MEQEIKIANSEIFEILSYMDKAQVMKIPVSLLENFKNNRKENYISRIDKNDIYNKNNISKRTLNILAYLNLNYWVDENKKLELVEQYRKNDIKNMKMLEEQYPIDIFAKKEKENQITIIKKEKIFKRIWQKILSIFKGAKWMNIDIEKAKEQFIKYTENYDLQNEHIKRKQGHSLRVMEISKQIAEGLELSQEEIKLATLIGLLHDVARFEQYTLYNTFVDIESIDHGDLGAEILEKDIRKYIETKQYDEIIKKAVKNHNKYEIEKGLTEKEELFAKIVRDADKIDIFYESVEMFWKRREKEIGESTISEKVVEQFKCEVQVKREKGPQKPIDNIVSVIAFIYDINFDSSFRIIKQEDYINKILNRYNFKDEKTKQQIEEIRRIANGYVEKNAK